MKRLFAIAVMASLVPFAAAAQIDEQRAELVGNCLITMADVEEDVLFYNLLIAMVDQDVGNANTFRTAIVARARVVGIERCNQPDTWFEEPWAGATLGYYIQNMLVSRFSASLQWLQEL